MPEWYVALFISVPERTSIRHLASSGREIRGASFPG